MQTALTLKALAVCVNRYNTPQAWKNREINLIPVQAVAVIKTKLLILAIHVPR